MSDISSAIARLQDIVAACTTVTFKSAPDFPVENVEPFPCSVAYISGGNFHFTNATLQHNFPEISLELHFARVNLKQAHQQIDEIVTEFPRRLAGDPMLNNTVSTVVATQEQPVTYEVRPYLWTAPNANPRIVSEMLKFIIPIKLRKAPIA